MTFDSGIGMFLALVGYPLIEETIFRWGVLHWLEQRDGAWSGLVNNIVSSIAFSAGHLAAWGGVHAMAVFVPSLVLGLAWQRWSSLWLCVALHSMFNLVGIAVDRAT